MPGQLKEVRSRIQAVKSTQQITKAMKLVAASKLRKAQDRITQMRPYSAKLNDMLGNIVAGGTEAKIDHAEQRHADNVMIVVLTSDRGLCGGFNTNVVKLVKGLLNDKYRSQRAAGKVQLLCIGKKGYDVLRKEANLQINIDYINLFGSLSFDNALEAAELVLNGFLDKKFDVVEVAYNQFRNQITQIPTVEQFLPIAKLDAPKSEKSGKDIKPDFIYQPNQEGIVRELVPKILKTRFFRFMLDSNASEHGARMTAMDNATNNADDLLRDLSIQYNRVRQAAITTEITEIVGGAAALQG